MKRMVGADASTDFPSRGRSPFPRTAALCVGLALIVSLMALAYEIGAQSVSSDSGPTLGPVVAYVNLTIQINSTTGAPQYVPANFSVPAGLVAITINDEDSPMSWPACMCNVSGTTGNVEYVNGTSYSAIPPSNVAHTFTMPKLGLNVLSPGGSTVFFEAVFQPGTYTWYCMAPCGLNGYTGFPMGVPGYMAGTVTVD